jgi:predicted ATPase
MIISRIELKNWRNFQRAEVNLGHRVFLIGPNASGKSNFLDVFRLLRDITKPGGGLQKAVSSRAGEDHPDPGENAESQVGKD